MGFGRPLEFLGKFVPRDVKLLMGNRPPLYIDRTIGKKVTHVANETQPRHILNRYVFISDNESNNNHTTKTY